MILSLTYNGCGFCGGDFQKFYSLNQGTFLNLKQKQINKYVLCISRTRLFVKRVDATRE
jgi:hypothetical protein